MGTWNVTTTTRRYTCARTTADLYGQTAATQSRTCGSSGCDLETSKCRELLGPALNGLGVPREGDALLVRATTQEFSLRKHNLVLAILAVNDLFYLAVPVAASLILEDVPHGSGFMTFASRPA